MSPGNNVGEGRAGAETGGDAKNTAGGQNPKGGETEHGFHHRPTGNPAPSTTEGPKAPPLIGFGGIRAPPDAIKAVVHQAINAGCTMFEVSAALGNEEPTGEALREAFQAGMRREDFYIICMLPSVYHRPDRIEAFCRESLERTGLDYYDLFVMGSPVAFTLTRGGAGEVVYYPTYCEHDDGRGHASAPCHKLLLDRVPIHQTWEAMEALVDAGLVRELGAGNLGVAMLHDLLVGARVRPRALYAEVHPLFQNWELIRYAQEEGLHVVAFLPLAGASCSGGTLCANPVVQRIAGARGVDPASVVLAWHAQRHPSGYSVICRTLDPAQVTCNMAASVLSLTAPEVHAIDGLESGARVFGGALNFGFPLFA